VRYYYIKLHFNTVANCLTKRMMLVDILAALGNTTESTIPCAKGVVRYSHVRRWRSTEIHQRGVR